LLCAVTPQITALLAAVFVHHLSIKIHFHIIPNAVSQLQLSYVQNTDGPVIRFYIVVSTSWCLS